MLLLMEVDSISKKGSRKRNLVKSSGSSSGKIVFTLLTKVIAFHIESIAIDIRKLGLELIPKSSFFCLGLEDQLNDLLQVHFSVADSVNYRNLGR